MKTREGSTTRFVILLALSVLLFHVTVNQSFAQSFSNQITFDNQSGSPAVVKLVGPNPRTVEVPNYGRQTVNVGPGTYYILGRYGSQPGRYTYTKGRPFNVVEYSDSYSVITITLHKVVGGNYETRPIPSAGEFERQ